VAREAPDDVLETLLGEAKVASDEMTCLLELHVSLPPWHRGAWTLARRVDDPTLLVASRTASVGPGRPDLAGIHDLDELAGPMAMSSSPRVTRLGRGGHGWWRSLVREKADGGE
jgi:hypothetical protein